MRKFFGILAFAASIFGIAACEQPETPADESSVVIFDGPVDLADVGFGMYYGDLDHNSTGVFSIVLSDAVCFRDGFGDPYLDSEGDMLVFEFLAPIDSKYEFEGLPVGEYSITDDAKVTPRINVANSYVKRLVGTNQVQYSLVSGNVNVSKDSKGEYKIETNDLVLKKGNDEVITDYSYYGTLKIDEWSKVAAQIQDLKSDIVDMPFPYVSAVYYGNLFGYGTGNYVVTLATDGFMDDDTGTVPGIAIVLNMFGELVPGDNEVLLKEGTYTVYPSFNYNEFSMLYGLNMDGIPFGTYLAQVDSKGTQSVEFISGGTVEVSRESINYEDVYTLKYSLNAPSRKVTGTWVGSMTFLDQSEGSGRVILSTLDGDVECDMSKVERGYMSHVETLKTTPLPSVDIAEAWQLWLEPRMWTDEEKELDWEDRINAWDPNGDIMILEFVVPLNSGGDIAPDKNEEYKYTIQPSLSMEDPLYQVSVSKMGRPYDDIFYDKNWGDYTYMTGIDARRGFTWDGGFRGNWYLHYIPGTWQNMDEMAPAVKGTVTVSRSSDYVKTTEGKEATFKFVWDLYDDAEASYNITGEWSGPVTITRGSVGDSGSGSEIEFE